MADKKITDLALKTTTSATDVVVIVDPGDNTTKRSTVAGLVSPITAGLANASIPFAKTSGIWWEEIGRATATANVTSLNVAALPNRKYITVIFTVIPTAATSITAFFNGDTAGNYTFRISDGGGTDTVNSSYGGLPLDAGSSPGAGAVLFGELHGVNINGKEKPLYGHILDTLDTGANPPRRREYQGKWRGTTVISSLNFAFGAACAAGTEVIVLGHD